MVESRGSFSLRRSVRWRLQLGLWTIPQSEEEEWSSADLYQHNADRLHEQRQQYTELLQHYHASLQEHQSQSSSARHPDGHGASPSEPKQPSSPTTTTAETAHTSSSHTTNNTTKNATTMDTTTLLDPLTAMVLEQEAQQQRRQALELKYRKERALRKRNVTPSTNNTEDGDRFDTYSSHQTWGVIEKDLSRLPPNHFTYYHALYHRLHDDDDSTLTEKATQERTDQLSKLLYVHAQEHPALGYRQGMHEIASHLLLVLEKDWLEVHADIHNNDDETNIELRVFQAEYLWHDAYWMLQHVMEPLAAAYDVRVENHASNHKKSPMEEMASRILRLIRDTAGDVPLYSHLLKLHCPPELYCTRWVRLLFSREVASIEKVWHLWDVFFDVTSFIPEIQSKRTPPRALSNFSIVLLQVLEATAASMVLLQRERLLQSSDVNESIHHLMNLQPLTNVVPLTALSLSLLRRQCEGVSLDSNNSSSSLLSSLGQSLSRSRSSLGQTARVALESGGESLRKLYQTTTTSSDTPSPQNALHEEWVPSTGMSSSSTTTTSRNQEPLLGMFLGEKSTTAAPADVAVSPAPVAPPLESRPERRHVVVDDNAATTPASTNTLFSVEPTTTTSHKKELLAVLNAATPTVNEKRAETLHHGVVTIQNYLQSLVVQENSLENIPGAIWDALADIDSVRLELLNETE